MTAGPFTEKAGTTAPYRGSLLPLPEMCPEKRAQALYSEDERQEIRQSHNNPQIIELYEKFLDEPNSHKAHKLLHTHYAAREGFNEVKR